MSPAPDPDRPPRVSLLEDVRALFEGVREWLAREAEFQKARAALAGRYLALIAAMAVLGAMLLFFTLMALVVGLLLALAPGLGPWGAMGAVLLGLVAAVLATVLAARSGWRRLRRVLGMDEDRS